MTASRQLVLAANGQVSGDRQTWHRQRVAAVGGDLSQA
jgi:hypothetical protein